MKWIHASDLERWAGTIGSRTGLSELVSSLIRASASERKRFHFPTGDSAQIPGYDGTLIATSKSPYVPDGNSVWEFGTESDYLEQANRNFDNRSEKPLSAEPAETSFVFVSARTWKRHTPSLEEWEKEKTSLGPWKKVRFIDAVQLESWLEDCPAAALDFATRVLGQMPPTGIRSTDQFWEEFSSRFKLGLTEDVLLCGRAKEAADLIQNLIVPAGVQLLRADSPEEVVAFAVAAIRKADIEARKYLEARTLIVEDEDSARRLQNRRNTTFLLFSAARRLAGALARHNPVLLPVGKEDSTAGVPVVLNRPPSYEMGNALRSMGFPEGEALQLARKTGRSVTVLERLIPSVSAIRPSWSSNPILVPAMLLGAWDSATDEDKKVVCELAGTETYDEYESGIRKYLKTYDAPLDREGSVWQLVAPVDAFVQLASLVGQEHLTRLASAVQRVFAEHDPELDLKPEEKPFAALAGKRLTHSGWLRDGLATTLLLFAAFEDAAELNIRGGAQAFVNGLVKSLPGLHEDWRVLASLSQQLPLLMEAAPRPLVEALELMLGGDGDGMRCIFRDTDPIFSKSPHTGLLWALETIAWDPEYLDRSALILAKLARIDPGGKLGNRPIESLRDIFLPWLPNTNATLAQRLAAIDAVVKSEPAIGWRLLLRLLPEHHSVGRHTSMPRFRESGEPEKEVVTNRLVWETYDQIIGRALALVGNDPERWTAIIHALPTFNPTNRDRASRLLQEFAVRANPEQRAQVWSALRDLVNRHRAFQDAAWALKSPSLDDLEAIARQLEPADPITRLAWLFDDYHPQLPRPYSETSLQDIEQARSDAIRRLFEQGDIDGIIRLAGSVKLPRLVGFAAASVADDLSVIDNLTGRSLEVGDKLKEFLVALSAEAERRHPEEWRSFVGAYVRDGRYTPDQVATILIWWRDQPSTWEFVASLGNEIQESYWKNKPVWPLGDDMSAAEMAAQMYLRADRAVAALDVLHRQAKFVAPEILLEALDQAVKEFNTKPDHLSTMSLWELETIFSALGSRPDVPGVEVARREYAYLPLLAHSNRPLILHRILSEDPNFFVSVLCDVFKPAHGEMPEPDEDARRRARAGYQLLSEMKLLPGEDSGKVNSERLNKWVTSVRELAAQVDRSKIADEYIGKILAHSPENPNGTWPSQIVCELLEGLASDSVELGTVIERHNMRGTFSKAIYEGGSQERALAAQAVEWAKTAARWPRAHGMLLQLARSWNDSAKREDERAKLNEMEFER